MILFCDVTNEFAAAYEWLFIIRVYIFVLRVGVQETNKYTNRCINVAMIKLKSGIFALVCKTSVTGYILLPRVVVFSIYTRARGNIYRFDYYKVSAMNFGSLYIAESDK